MDAIGTVSYSLYVTITEMPRNWYLFNNTVFDIIAPNQFSLNSNKNVTLTTQSPSDVGWMYMVRLEVCSE